MVNFAPPKICQKEEGGERENFVFLLASPKKDVNVVEYIAESLVEKHTIKKRIFTTEKTEAKVSIAMKFIYVNTDKYHDFPRQSELPDSDCIFLTNKYDTRTGLSKTYKNIYSISDVLNDDDYSEVKERICDYLLD